MTTPSEIRPTDWHRHPADRGQPCPICGLLSRPAGEHRATADDEGLDAIWQKRCYRADGSSWFRHVGSRSGRSRPGDKPPKRRRGPTQETIRKIARATNLLAQGLSMKEAAASIGVALETLRELSQKYRQLWEHAEKSAAETIQGIIDQAASQIREQAGTAAVLLDPDLFLKRAEFVGRHLAARGESLFPVSEKMTIGKFFEAYYLPNCLADGSDGQRELYRVLVRRWAIFTGDPSIGEITPGHMSRFRDCLAKVRGLKAHLPMTATTIAGYLRRLQTLLDKAGPPGPRNRDAAGIIERSPWIKPPRQSPKLPRIVSPETFRAVYDGCVAAELPRISGFKPAAWWRCLMIVAKNTGLRRKTLLRMRMEHIDWKARRLVLPAEFLKSNRPLVMPLNREAYEHLLAIRTAREVVFEWPHCRRYLHTYFHKIQTVAGIPKKDHFGLHDLRKTLASQLARGSLAAAQFALGHAASDVTMRHYVDSQTVLVDALENLPQPFASEERAPA